MRLPIENLMTDLHGLGLVVSLLIGFGFGFVLERAGFGRSTKLAAQFYFRDMTVLKVMFTAIVTAMLGLCITGRLGIVELDAVLTSGASFTFLWPMIVGGLVLGIGFIVSGYCPGTSLVATASGNIDGMVTFLGVIIGSVIYGEIYGLIAGFATSGAMGHLFLPDVLGLERPFVAFLVTLMAIGAFIGAEKLEKRFGGKTDGNHPETRRHRHTVFGVLGASAVAGILIALVGFPTAAEPSSPSPLRIEADVLAHRIIDEPWKVRVIDLRGESAWTKARIPSSEPVALDELEELGLQYVENGNDLVIVDRETTETLPPEIAAYKGRVFTLGGGFPAWNEYVNTAPPPLSADATDDERERYLFRSMVNELFTGQAAAAPPPRPVRNAAPRPAAGGGGCS